MLSLDTLPRAQLLTMVIVSRTAKIAAVDKFLGFPRNARLNYTVGASSCFVVGSAL